MTPAELVYTEALARVNFPPKCSCVKFIDSMVSMARYRPSRVLSPAQSKYLCSCVLRFHRQINGLTVESARKELARLKAAEQAGGAR